MEDFVTFDLAKKLKEKGFTCKYPFAMYNKFGSYCPLTTSSDNVTCELVNKCRCYHEYDENDIIAPTISQVLKWLRMEKKISIEIGIHYSLKWMCSIYGFSDGIADFTQYDNDSIDDTIYILYDSYEQATLAGIEYVLDNLI